MFFNLKAEMARKNITITTLSEDEDLDIVYETLRNKFSMKTEWTRREMMLIKDKYFPDQTLEYLFKWDVSKT